MQFGAGQYFFLSLFSGGEEVSISAAVELGLTVSNTIDVSVTVSISVVTSVAVTKEVGVTVTVTVGREISTFAEELQKGIAILGLAMRHRRRLSWGQLSRTSMSSPSWIPGAAKTAVASNARRERY